MRQTERETASHRQADLADPCCRQVAMAPPSCLLTEEQLLCDVCLDVFSDPVTVPCGHTFCRACVERHWEDSVQHHCPTCKEAFYGRLELQANRVISDVILHFRGAQRSPQLAKGGDVACDMCSEPKLKAFKSCLACLASYCEIHLKPHLSVYRLKQHQLTVPTEHLEQRMCPRHEKPLELFCKTDQTCVCMLCPVHDHKSHDIGLLKEQYEKKTAELGRREEEIQEMIQERQRAILNIRHTIKLSKCAAQREMANGVQVFAALKRSLRRAEVELLGTIEERQKTAETQAKSFIQELEQEISELLIRQAEAEQLRATKDHLHFLQNLKTLSPSTTKDWTAVSVNLPSHEGALRSTVDRLRQTLGEEMETLVIEAELNCVRQFSVDVNLDPDTAHSSLVLSEDGKRVHHGVGRRNLLDNPKRFDPCCCVLARQAFSSGRFYFEVQVQGKSRWTVGVAKASVQRKGVVPLCPANGHWSVWLKNGTQYAALVGTPRPLTLRSKPRRVGVFVDFDKGLVSFYDGDTAAVLYSFTGCCFTEKLLPFFSPGINDDGGNSAPLVLFNPTECR